MKIRIMSDLHLESQDWIPCESSADVTILAGDISNKGRGVKWAASAIKGPVIYVAGNHEYYGGSLGKTFDDMKKDALGTNIHFLENEEVIIDGVRFLGATLWTDYNLTGNYVLAQLEALRAINDFFYIRNKNYDKLIPSILRQLHVNSRDFLASSLDKPFPGKTVIVTHQAPSEGSIHSKYRGIPGHLNASYASNLESLMGDKVSLWVHGHTHTSFDYERNGTRIICNPRGCVPSEPNPEFIEDLVVEVN